jgi:hypothetical protein
MTVQQAMVVLASRGSEGGTHVINTPISETPSIVTVFHDSISPYAKMHILKLSTTDSLSQRMARFK